MLRVTILKTIANTLNIAEGNLTIISLNVTDSLGAAVDVAISITSDIVVKYSVVTAEGHDAKVMITALNAAMASYHVSEPGTSGGVEAGGGSGGASEKTSNAFSQLLSTYLSTPVTVTGTFFNPQALTPDPTVSPTPTPSSDPTDDPTAYPTFKPTSPPTGNPSGTAQCLRCADSTHTNAKMI